ncbi:MULTISPECIES: toll/interleukin-1 receptor domain-containing protein [unclassified Chryseobacterium]|uniref:toll/interleukin-1 receptor domain-containing protein n=1 Tax=unclassified Chryseobacterium TaxID=2593645 RepID=UPI0028534668|nr:toll/interleukin-1 receptor domain-containing protein [Chryseobacterium sp. CFS7]MDR4892290.1 toll/interleukin-1 receptor domain-containing protein [Chryseobacterium sp. CFS7]
MEIRKDFISVEAELHKSLLLAESLREMDSNWIHDKNNEDMDLIYHYDVKHYSSIELLYSYGRSMARGLSYDLASVNNAGEYGTLYSWVKKIEESWEGSKEFYEKVMQDALHAQEKTRRFNCVIQMVQTLKDQLKILDSVLILIAILKTKDLYLLEERVINKTMSAVSKDKSPKESYEYDVFISHASEDKNTFVEKFCQHLSAENIKFWYDSNEIAWGESLIRKINQGLSKSRFSIIILSKSFVDKKWTNAELEAVLNIETVTGDVRVLPLMLGDPAEIKSILTEYPLLATKRYLNVSDGIDNIVENLKNVLSK